MKANQRKPGAGMRWRLAPHPHMELDQWQMWQILVRSEVLKLHERGERVRLELLRWAEGTADRGSARPA